MDTSTGICDGTIKNRRRTITTIKTLVLTKKI